MENNWYTVICMCDIVCRGVSSICRSVYPVYAEAYAEVYAAMYAEVYAEVYAAVYAEVYAEVYAAVYAEVYAEVCVEVCELTIIVDNTYLLALLIPLHATNNALVPVVNHLLIPHSLYGGGKRGNVRTPSQHTLP